MLAKIINNDLFIVAFVTILLIITILFIPSSALQVIFGFPVAILFPGYTLLAALFPRRIDLDNLEILALSAGLSITSVALIGLILNYTPWGIKPYPVLFSIAFFILANSAIALIGRRKRLPAGRTGIDISNILKRWSQSSSAGKALAAALTLSILVTIGTMVYVISTKEVGERFTQFYLGENYPKETKAGEETGVEVYIINQERKDMAYQIKVVIDGVTQDETKPVALTHQEKWQGKVNLKLIKEGKQKVELLLYRRGDDNLYLRLDWMLDVK